jgi:hypothetical protein
METSEHGQEASRTQTILGTASSSILFDFFEGIVYPGTKLNHGRIYKGLIDG